MVGAGEGEREATEEEEDAVSDLALSQMMLHTTRFASATHDEEKKSNRPMMMMVVFGSGVTEMM